MAHRTLKSGYNSLAERINRFPQGAPPTTRLFRILRMMFREREAELVALLPIKPFTAADAGRIWKMNLVEARKILDELASRALLVDWDRDGETHYVLPPPMAGFFEFSMMRVRDDLDQKALAELLYQYLNVEEDFVKDLFTRGETQLGRTFVHEPALSPDNSLHVLDYERATHVIESASHIGVGRCYCRHKMEHVGRACDAPQQICMTFNTTADSLIRHDHATRIDKEQGMDLLQEAWDRGLVQFGENARRKVAFICNCCGCCCEALNAARRFAILNPVHTTNFLPRIDEAECNGCTKCTEACPVEGMALVSANDPSKPRRRLARVNEQVCLGCGVCVRACPKDAIHLESRAERVLTPVDGAHRIVTMAIERGKLQHLIFDNRVLWSHRALAAVLGVILELPPVKQALAKRQAKSMYLETMIARSGH